MYIQKTLADVVVTDKNRNTNNHKYSSIYHTYYVSCSNYFLLDVHYKCIAGNKCCGFYIFAITEKCLFYENHEIIYLTVQLLPNMSIYFSHISKSNGFQSNSIDLIQKIRFDQNQKFLQTNLAGAIVVQARGVISVLLGGRKPNNFVRNWWTRLRIQ